jgi:UDP-N-acetylmuramoyl-tripeptide--D-alanyl-D-alanine ligase
MYPVGDIARIVGGDLLRGDGATPVRIVHDSREVSEGDLFVALRGRRTDGHAFLSDVFARGACGALISDPSSAPTGARNLIVVDDPLGALQRLAAAWRRKLGATFVGITGSNGKTTTRALLAHLLAGADRPQRVFSAPKNYNTDVGLPLALLAMPEATSIGLFELGAERPGDVAALADVLAPRVGLITSVGPSHLDGLGSVEAVAREKWSLVERLPPDGIGVVNADSPDLHRLVQGADDRCTTVGIEHGDVRGRIEQEVPRLVLAVDDPPMRLAAPLIGRHNAVNLLLAGVTAHRLGVPPGTIEGRAETFVPVPHRLEPIDAPFGTVLDDTYNANPASTAGALRALARCGGPETRRVFVFGEMRDLGPDADRYHREAVDLALDLGIDAVLPVGDRAVAACRERSTEAVTIVDRAELADAVRALCRDSADALVLVKGSRALELERLVDELVRDVG